MLKILRNYEKLPKNVLQCTCYSTDKARSDPPPPSSEPEKTSKDLQSAPVEKYDPKSITKSDMQWRTPWHYKEGKYFSALRAMSSDDNQTSLMKFLHQDIDLRPSAIKRWWNKKQEYKEIMMQSYLPERNQILGNELAAAHFLVHRGGAVKFHGQNNWVKADQSGKYSLPRFYDESRILEAIDCTDMNLYYEGLVNLRDLKKVEWLSLNGVRNVDDWFLDRTANIFKHSLVYLDLRNCPMYTHRGLCALWKMEKLKMLYIDDFLMTESFEMTCLMLQDSNKHLDIKIGD